eukprot:TRINITY_DN10179_c0_g1_i1.p1 TRINITY_DN10179_c0_g1~~TRINITY_DN10179_c0_g1_i1.p1  ORF type:complete len:132 (+),score=5.06 TRINITY_DN10179_c0_g1_i1:60-398(+)
MSDGDSAHLGPSDQILNESFDGLEILTIESEVKYENKPKATSLSNSRKRLLEERNETEEQAKKKQKLLPTNPSPGSAKLGGRSVAVPPKASSKYGPPSSNSNAPKSTSKPKK